MERPESVGRMAITKTRTPIPPTQCVKERQKRSPWLIRSTSVRIEAPVVVKPLTVSKKASTKEGISRLKKKGRAPTSDISSHASDTMAKPSLAKMVRSRGVNRTQRRSPSSSAAPMLAKKE